MNFYFREEWRAPAAVGVAAFSAGVGVGYLVCLKRTKTVVIEETIEVDFVEEVEDVGDPNQLAIDFARAAAEQASHPVAAREQIIRPRWASDIPEGALDEVADPEPEMSQEPIDEWNQEEEEADRGPDAPYVIHQDEFNADQNGYRQTALEYFSGDDVLCDENRVPLYNPGNIVGRLEFGRGSGDSNVVFVRNDKLESEFEITRVDGSYQHEVLGMLAEEAAEETDLKHSVRRFRNTD